MRISDRAGVGIRWFFRHFEDMEALSELADNHIRESYEALFLGGDRDGTLTERVDQGEVRQADAYESVSNIVLGAHAQLWGYEILRKNYARNQRGLRKDLNDWLPELKSGSRDVRESIDAIASFEMWHRLRYHHNTSKKASIGVIRSLLKSLIPDD